MWCTSAQPASARRPETRWRFHLSRCPVFGVHFSQGAALAADERAELIRLQLNEVEIAQHPMIEARGGCRGPLEPSHDGGAGMARHSGGRRNTDALDAQARDLVELPSTAAKTAVRGPGVRAERSPAYFAAIPPPSARLRRKPAVAHDVAARFSKVVALGLAARSLVDRAHRPSVPARRTPSICLRSHVCEGGRSTATGTSTGCQETEKRRGTSAFDAIHAKHVGHCLLLLSVGRW